MDPSTLPLATEPMRTAAASGRRETANSWQRAFGVGLLFEPQRIEAGPTPPWQTTLPTEYPHHPPQVHIFDTNLPSYNLVLLDQPAHAQGVPAKVGSEWMLYLSPSLQEEGVFSSVGSSEARRIAAARESALRSLWIEEGAQAPVEPELMPKKKAIKLSAFYSISFGVLFSLLTALFLYWGQLEFGPIDVTFAAACLLGLIAELAVGLTVELREAGRRAPT